MRTPRDVKAKSHPTEPTLRLVRFGRGKWRTMSQFDAERLQRNDALAVLRDARKRAYKPRKKRKRQLRPAGG